MPVDGSTAMPRQVAVSELSGFQNKVHQVEREKWWGCWEHLEGKGRGQIWPKYTICKHEILK